MGGTKSEGGIREGQMQRTQKARREVEGKRRGESVNPTKKIIKKVTQFYKKKEMKKKKKEKLKAQENELGAETFTNSNQQ